MSYLVDEDTRIVLEEWGGRRRSRSRSHSLVMEEVDTSRSRPRAAIVGGCWPFCEHTPIGMMAQICQAAGCRGTNSIAHLAILFENIGPNEARQAAPYGFGDINKPHVFEVLVDRPPSFHTLETRPWSTTRRILAFDLVVEGRDAFVADLLIACIEACAAPYTYRCNTHLNAACPCFCFDVGQLCCNAAVTSTNCVGIILLLLARARSPGTNTDADVTLELGLSHGGVLVGLARLFGASIPLSVYTPTEAIDALQRAGILATEDRGGWRGRDRLHRRLNSGRYLQG